MSTQLSADEIIDALGGTSETARMFSIEPPSVTGWRRHGIPEARLMYLRVVRPDLFPPTPPEPKHAPRKTPKVPD